MPHTTRRLLLTLAVGSLAARLGDLRAQGRSRPRQFVYVLRVSPRFQDQSLWTEREAAVVARHFARLSAAAARGQVILAGRTTESLADTFGVVIFEARDADDARDFMLADPAVLAGLMSATLHPYAVALQRRTGAE